MIGIELEGLTKYFGNQKVIDNLDLRIKPGEILALLGPSGCGKTTTLNLIAGLLQPDRGDIFFAGRSVTGVPAEKRSSVLVFQEYMLFPHLSVEDNISFGMRMAKKPLTERRKRVEELLALIDLQGHEKDNPQQLSGGEKQRVALARAAAINPEVFLLDEPLSNLDTALREEMQQFIRDIHVSEEMTTIFVTHDREEAMLMADRIAVMNEGKIIQSGCPQQLYEQPESKFVADFLGPANYLQGELEGKKLKIADKNIKLTEKNISSGIKTKVDSEVSVLLRPEFFDLFQNKKVRGDNIIEVTVVSKHYIGNRISYEVKLDEDNFLKVTTLPPSEFEEGEKICLSIEPQNIWVMNPG